MSEMLPLPVVEANRFGSCWVWTDDSLAPERARDLLERRPGRVDLIQVGSGGRGSAWHVDVNGKPAVLRYYRRGGMMAHVNQDRYLWQGPELTRPCQEFRVMLGLADAGFLVAKPIAAMADRTGIFYRAAILTRFVEHRGALCEVDDEAAWHAAGQAIGRLHAAGVWHADLNVHNILIGHDDRAWLIDFDRAQAGVTDAGRLQGNLSRLLRSVRKVCPELGHRLWPVLLDGYADRQKFPQS